MSTNEYLDPQDTQGPQNRAQRSVQWVAADPRTGMTLDEMAALVQDAMRADIDGATPIKVTVGFRSQVRTAKIEEER
ncbi:hypothetical protein BMR99_03430 [Propionibacterium freudenreichii]|uniref:Uncharacterized protein n=1 Tax=Propionibacterium freudenreichii TaxID=1744 RepID=A0A509MJL3_9ACTN|nr:hypothetical protein [Propionibacterium freudenreichii]ARO11702.1 hypothetical protein BMR99_03430 [Propionibacterium freudenreichii]SCQ79628.1 Hypothetical protein PFR_JS23_1441 [Propionibacterium freudenreichii]SCQ83252.1 Hypothetical protein PFR_JS23-PH_48 [Propionibacterium freudenreichii]SUY93606.1 Hypothetical protein PFR_JS23-PH_48 [Propionibacterium freudenreichii]